MLGPHNQSGQKFTANDSRKNGKTYVVVCKRFGHCKVSERSEEIESEMRDSQVDCSEKSKRVRRILDKNGRFLFLPNSNVRGEPNFLGSKFRFGPKTCMQAAADAPCARGLIGKAFPDTKGFRRVALCCAILCKAVYLRLASCLVHVPMDADLYDHLKTTITNDPHQDDSDDTDIEKIELPERQGQSDSAPASNNGDNTRRKRTMSSSLPQEIDQVVHAISSSQWATRLGALMGSVRKQVFASLN
jgi:hypothetical protein